MIPRVLDIDGTKFYSTEMMRHVWFCGYKDLEYWRSQGLPFECHDGTYYYPFIECQRWYRRYAW
jgi:hypothetical protein